MRFAARSTTRSTNRAIRRSRGSSSRGDARRDRIYLPQNELQRFGVSSADIFQRHVTSAFKSLMRFQVERARDLYSQALSSLPRADRRAQRPGLVMAAIYRALLDEIARD